MATGLGGSTALFDMLISSVVQDADRRLYDARHQDFQFSFRRNHKLGQRGASDRGTTTCASLKTASKEGTKIAGELAGSSDESLFPLQAAHGYSPADLIVLQHMGRAARNHR